MSVAKLTCDAGPAASSAPDWLPAAKMVDPRELHISIIPHHRAAAGDLIGQSVLTRIVSRQNQLMLPAPVCQLFYKAAVIQFKDGIPQFIAERSAVFIIHCSHPQQRLKCLPYVFLKRLFQYSAPWTAAVIQLRLICKNTLNCTAKILSDSLRIPLMHKPIK